MDHSKLEASSSASTEGSGTQSKPVARSLDSMQVCLTAYDCCEAVLMLHFDTATPLGGSGILRRSRPSHQHRASRCRTVYLCQQIISWCTSPSAKGKLPRFAMRCACDWAALHGITTTVMASWIPVFVNGGNGVGAVVPRHEAVRRSAF